MSLTHEDIQQRKFKTRFRGFDINEVDSFLNEVAENFLALVQENNRLNERLAEVEKQYEHVLQEQRETQATIDSAQSVADDLKNKGRQDAEAFIAQASADIKAKQEELDGERAKIRAEKERSVREAGALIARAKKEIQEKHEQTEQERAKIKAEMAQAQEEIKTMQQEAETKVAVTKAEIEECNTLKAKIRQDLRALLNRYLKQIDAELPHSAVTAPFTTEPADIVFETDDESEREVELDEEILMQLFQGVDPDTLEGQEMTSRPEEDDDLSDLFQSVDLGDAIDENVGHTLEELNENLVLAKYKPAASAAAVDTDEKNSPD